MEQFEGDKPLAGAHVLQGQSSLAACEGGDHRVDPALEDFPPCARGKPKVEGRQPAGVGKQHASAEPQAAVHGEA